MDEQNFNLAQNVVLETLRLCVSQNPEFLKSSEEKLKEWERVPGFNTLLQNIFSNYEIDHNIRHMAILCCKNGIDRYWRKTAPNAFSEDEKANLRRGFLADFQEPQSHLAKQKAVLIAKIARNDCPQFWPELIPTLLEAVQNEDPIIQNRSILILRQVIKQLSSKCLANDRRMFKQLAESIFNIVLSLWNNHTRSFFSKFNTDYGQARSSLENALIALRILDKLTVYGFNRPDENKDVSMFVYCLLYDQIKNSLQIRHDILRGRDINSLVPLEKEYAQVVEKFICKQFSILLNLLEIHPFAFIEFIKGSLELSMYYAFTSEGHVYLFERFLIQCFNMIKAILLCPEYRFMRYCIDTEDSPDTLRANDIKKSFFEETMVMEICRKLITHYFLLTPADLELWESDPENFATDDAGESWKYSLRPCVETLFVTVFHEYREMLAPLLVELIKGNAGIVSPDDFDAILAKDAVYNAIGLTAFDMYDEVNFDDWFVMSLRQELSISGNNYRIVRRRVAWLLSRWTGVKLSVQLYPALYSAMIPLLSPQEDLVVRLQAAHTIKTVVDDFGFNTELFLEFLQPLFDALFQLLKDVQECETKMKVLSVLYFIVERVGLSIEPYYEKLLKFLPLLWNESENHNMLRCAVVGTLVHLIKTLGHIKVPMDIHDFILSIISFSTDMSHDSGFYLLEDGLELWLAIVENINEASPDIMQLFSKMPVLLASNTEYLKTSISIMQAYILLAPEEFLKTHGENLVKTCMSLFHDLDTVGMKAILKMFELCIKVKEQLAIPLLKPFLQTSIEYLYRADKEELDWSLITLTTIHFSLLSRVLLSSKEVFFEIVDKICANTMKTRDEIIGSLLDHWFKHMPLISLSLLDRKKLNALALASLLTANSNFVYDKFCGILRAVVEVLNDLTRVDFNGEVIDKLMFTECSNSSDDESLETEHEKRRKKLVAADPVYSVVLEKYFRYQLNELEMMVGPEKFKQFFDAVDVETLDMLCLYINFKTLGTSNDLIKLFSTQLGI